MNIYLAARYTRRQEMLMYAKDPGLDHDHDSRFRAAYCAVARYMLGEVEASALRAALSYRRERAA